MLGPSPTELRSAASIQSGQTTVYCVFAYGDDIISRNISIVPVTDASHPITSLLEIHGSVHHVRSNWPSIIACHSMNVIRYYMGRLVGFRVWQRKEAYIVRYGRLYVLIR